MFALNDQPGGVEGIALLRRGENPSEVLKALKAAVEELNSSGLPHGVRIRAIYDRTELVHNTVATVSRTLLEGLTIVIFMLMFFLGSPRAAILTALTIPVSLLFAFISVLQRGPNLRSARRFQHHRGRHSDGQGILEICPPDGIWSGKENDRPDSEAALEVGPHHTATLLVAAYHPLFTLVSSGACSRRWPSPCVRHWWIPDLPPRPRLFLFRKGAAPWQPGDLAWAGSGRSEAPVPIIVALSAV
jgi:cobalt-zinc-cadmium resistance protein CzcA